MKFNEKLLKLRKEFKLNQSELANITGLSTPCISKLERGCNPNPSKETLVKLAEFFNVTVDFLVRDNSPLLLSETQNSYTIKFARLNQADQILVHRLMDRLFEDYEN